MGRLLNVPDICFENATHTSNPHPRQPVFCAFVRREAENLRGGYGVLREKDQADSGGELL